MRIATALYHQQAIESIGRRNEKLAMQQEQLASGKRINRPSDDPIGAAETERIRASNAQMAIEQRMMSFSTGMLNQADHVLAGTSETLQSMSELLVAAGNGSLQPKDRAVIATQLEGMRSELLALANHADGAGGYVFGGQGSATPPFTSGGSPAFQPSAGTQQTGLGLSFDTTVDGSKVFLGDGSAATTGSVFGAIDTIIGHLKNTTISGDALTAGLGTAMGAVDRTFDRMLMARTSVGEQLRALESRGRLVESGQLQASSRLADISSTDYAAVVSDMQSNQLAVEAAMRTYSQISKLSLFNYL